MQIFSMTSVVAATMSFSGEAPTSSMTLRVTSLGPATSGAALAADLDDSRITKPITGSTRSLK